MAVTSKRPSLGKHPSDRPFDIQGFVKADGIIVFSPEQSIAAVTGTVSTSQVAQTLQVQGYESYIGAVSTSQKKQTLSAIGAESFSGVVSISQVKQTLSVTGRESYSGTVAASQVKQSLSVVGRESFAGTVFTAQIIQTLSASGQESYLGSVSTTQPAQTLAATNAEIDTASVYTSQPAQTIDTEGSVGAAPIPAIPYDPYQRANPFIFLYPFMEVPKQRQRLRGQSETQQEPNIAQASGRVVLVISGSASTSSGVQKTDVRGRKDTFDRDAKALLEIILMEAA